MKLPHIFLMLLFAISTFSCSNDNIITDDEKEWLEKHNDIEIAIYPYYPPYQLLDENGEVNGIFLEYLQLVENKIDYTFKKVIFKTWPDLMDAVRAKEVDMIMEIHPTRDRETYLNFYAKIFETPYVIVTRNDAKYGDKIQDFWDKDIIIPKDYAIAENIKQKYPQLNIVFGKNDVTCLKRLNAGEFEAYIGPKSVVNYQIKTENLDNLKIVSKTEFNYSSGIAVYKKNRILNNIIAKATKNISRADTEKITGNWLFAIVTPYYKTTQFWFFFTLITLLLLAFIITTNYYLKFKIKKRTEQLLITKEVAEESNNLKTNFIDNIPYEIQTPMNGIIGLSEFLKDESITEKERKKYTQMIIGSSKTLISIIDNILEVSKLQTKRVAIKLTETNLSTIFQNLHSFYEVKAIEKNIKISLKSNINPEDNLILIDRAKLKKILNPLLENAIKFTDSGFIIISYTIVKELLVISIEDTGCGIKERYHQQIRESLSQKAVVLIRDLKGLGFGLTIAKRNADFIGGEIEFSSTPNKGSIFTLTIPYTKSKKSTDPTNSITNPKKITKKERHIILIAEDVETNFLYLKTILSKMKPYNFVIYRAKNGKEAITICEEHKNIDLVLMDIKMPIMNGYDATKYIKKMRPDLPIIAQTAYSVEEDIEKALEAGCDDFISKPVDKKLLSPILKKYFPVLKNKS